MINSNQIECESYWKIRNIINKMGDNDILSSIDEIKDIINKTDIELKKIDKANKDNKEKEQQEIDDKNPFSIVSSECREKLKFFDFNEFKKYKFNFSYGENLMMSYPANYKETQSKCLSIIKAIKAGIKDGIYLRGDILPPLDVMTYYISGKEYDKTLLLSVKLAYRKMIDSGIITYSNNSFVVL